MIIIPETVVALVPYGRDYQRRLPTRLPEQMQSHMIPSLIVCRPPKRHAQKYSKTPHGMPSPNPIPLSHRSGMLHTLPAGIVFPLPPSPVTIACNHPVSSRVLSTQLLFASARSVPSVTSRKLQVGRDLESTPCLCYRRLLTFLNGASPPP